MMFQKRITGRGKRKEIKAVSPTVLLIMIAVMVFLVFYAIGYIDKAASIQLHKYRTVLTTCYGVLLAFSLLCRFIGKDLRKTFLIFFFSIGIMNQLVFPVYTVPDEGTHYLKAYSISNQMFGIEDQDHTLTMRQCDCELFEKANAYDNVYNKTVKQYRKYWTALAHEKKVTSGGTIVIQTQILKAPGFLYAGSAAGISLGRILHLGPIRTFLLVRMINLLIAGLVIFAAIMLNESFGMILFLVSLFPITMQQLASVSYDSFLLSFLFLAISIIDLLYRHQEHSRKNLILWIILIVIGLLFLKIKSGAYLPIFLIPFFLLIYRFFKKKGWMKYFWIGLAAAALLIAVAAIVFIQHGMQEIPDYKTVEWLDNRTLTQYNWAYFARNFDQVPVFIYNTFNKFSSYYLESMISNHFRWNNTDVPSILSYGLALIFVLISMEIEARYSKKMTFTVTFVILMNAILICAAMLFGWTTYGARYIEGVQGRYFIPLLPLAAIPLSALPARHKEKYFSRMAAEVIVIFSYLTYTNII